MVAFSAECDAGVADDELEDHHFDFGGKVDERFGEVTRRLEGPVSTHDAIHDSREAVEVCWVGHPCKSAMTRLLK